MANIGNTLLNGSLLNGSRSMFMDTDWYLDLPSSEWNMRKNNLTMDMRRILMNYTNMNHQLCMTRYWTDYHHEGELGFI